MAVTTAYLNNISAEVVHDAGNSALHVIADNIPRRKSLGDKKR